METTILKSGEQTTASPNAYEVLTISASAGASASITRLPDQPGQVNSNQPETLASDETKEFGPFASPARFDVRNVGGGTVTIDLSPADFPSVDTDIQRIRKLTQAEYDALTPDATTLYLIDG